MTTVTEKHETEMASVKDEIVIVKQVRCVHEKVIKDLREVNSKLRSDLEHMVEDPRCTWI